MENSRTKKSVKNIIFAVIGQLLAIGLGFYSRYYFVDKLGNDFLGLNGLFTSILSFLSLSEIGIGGAIIVSLYKPLAINDTEKIKSIMAFYKKVYTTIGIIVLTFGLLVIPFIRFFSDNPIMDDPKIYLYYFFFLIGNVSTYFYAYKRAILTADQNKYIDTIIHYVFFIFLNIIQIWLLIAFENYLFYLIAIIVSNILENIFISIVVNKKYVYLKQKYNRISTEDKEKIVSDTKGLIFHKLGSTIINSTDNILISLLVSLTIVGIYSNYLLIVFAVNSIIGQIFLAITASIGNLNVNADDEHKEKVFYMITIINFIISVISCICMLILFNTFIEIWLKSRGFLLENIHVFLIVGIHFVGSLRRPVLLFKDAFGLFRQDMYKPIIEVFVNLIISISLGYFYGLTGILIGTIASGLLVSFWFELLVLYKYGLKSRKIYKYFGYSSIFIGSCIVSYVVLFLIFDNYFTEVSVFNFIIKTIISLGTTALIGFGFFSQARHFKMILKQGLETFLIRKKQIKTD